MNQEILELKKRMDEQQVLDLKLNGYLNECFFNADGSLTEQYKVSLKQKKKYVYLDVGDSGKYLIDSQGVWTIKAYGQKNHFKGSVQEVISSVEENIKKLNELSLNLKEADEISNEDLEATAEFYDKEILKTEA